MPKTTRDEVYWENSSYVANTGWLNEKVSQTLKNTNKRHAYWENSSCIANTIQLKSK